MVQRDSTISPYDAISLAFKKYEGQNSLGLSAWLSAVSLISSSVAQCEYEVKQVKDNAKTIVDHQITHLMYDGRLSYYNLWHNVTKDVIQHGNGYIYIKRKKATGEPERLIYTPATKVSIMYDEITDTCKYIIATTNKDVNVKREVLESDMLHFYIHSYNGYEGVSLVSLASRVIGLSNSLESKATDFFKSGCCLDGVLKFKGRLLDEQKKAIRQNWQNLHSADGSGLAILEGDVDYQPIAAKANEAQMLESRKFSVNEIARIFNLSPILLGGDGNSYSDLEQANLQFLQSCLQQYLTCYQEEIDRKLLKGTNLFSCFNTTPLVRTKKTEIATYLKNLKDSGILSTNECRNLLDYNAVEGGDAIFVAYTDIQQNTISQNTVTE